MAKLQGGPVQASSNLTSQTGPKKDMNFKVPADFHFKFKVESMKNEVQMKEFLYMVFDHWMETKAKD